MNEHTHDADQADAGPLEAALQDEGGQKPESPRRTNIQDQASQGSGEIQDSGAAGGDQAGSEAPATAGRGSFTTPGSVSSVQDVASSAESYSDPIAGEAASGAEILEEAKRRM
jgi:hypothetical protein